jgi:hypothetical protein
MKKLLFILSAIISLALFIYSFDCAMLYNDINQYFTLLFIALFFAIVSLKLSKF